MIKFTDVCYCSEATNQLSFLITDQYEIMPDNTCYLIVDETSHWLEFLCAGTVLYLNKKTDGGKYVHI